MRTLRTIPILAAWVAGTFCPTLAAQPYPSRPVRIVVPVTTGGATDILTRALGQRLSSVWGQQVLVDNRPGGGSNVGFEVVARAPADGYTLLMAQPAFTVNVSLYKKLAYDPLRDFSPVTLTAATANVLVIHPLVPVRTLKDFIALAKSRPGQLNYASSGNGSSPHLAGELFNTMAGVKIVHIPYKGAGASVTDLLGGHIDLAFLSISSTITQIKAGRLRALAVTSAKRSMLIPDLPTFAEAGLRGYEVTGWYGIVAPAGTPRDIIQRVHGDLSRTLAQPELMQSLAGFGIEPVAANTPDEFAAFLQAEISKWAKVVKAAGAKAD